MGIRQLATAFALVTVCFSAGLSYQLWQQNKTQLYYQHCQLSISGHCEWQLNDQQWTLQLPSPPLATMISHPLTLSTSAKLKPDLNLRFTGLDMYMGEVVVKLKASDDGIYRGLALLPICSDGEMRWLAQLNSADNSIALSFEVNTQ